MSVLGVFKFLCFYLMFLFCYYFHLFSTNFWFWAHLGNRDAIGWTGGNPNIRMSVQKCWKYQSRWCLYGSYHACRFNKFASKRRHVGYCKAHWLAFVAVAAGVGQIQQIDKYIFHLQGGKFRFSGFYRAHCILLILSLTIPNTTFLIPNILATPNTQCLIFHASQPGNT